MAADIQTGEQYTSTGSMNAKYIWQQQRPPEKHSLSSSKYQPSSRQKQQLLRLAPRRLTLSPEYRLKSLTLRPFQNNSTINNQIREQGFNRTRTRNKHPLALLGFTNIPHLLHQSLITAKSSFNDPSTDALSRGCGILQSEA